jgi:hypothetical protein
MLGYQLASEWDFLGLIRTPITAMAIHIPIMDMFIPTGTVPVIIGITDIEPISRGHGRTHDTVTGTKPNGAGFLRTGGRKSSPVLFLG